MKKIGGILFFLLSGFVAAGLVYLYQETKEKELRRIRVQQEIKNIGRIVLLEQHYRSILAIQNTKQFLGITFSRNRMLLGVPYRIRYGVDLSKGIRLVPKGKTLTVYYPAPEIFDIEILHQNIETFTYSGKIQADDFLPLIQDERQNLKAQLSSQYSRITENNLALFLEQFLAPLGYEEIILQEVQS